MWSARRREFEEAAARERALVDSLRARLYEMEAEEGRLVTELAAVLDRCVRLASDLADAREEERRLAAEALSPVEASVLADALETRLEVFSPAAREAVSGFIVRLRARAGGGR